MIKPDGGLHLLMESQFSLECALTYAEAESAFRITRTNDGVRVEGRRRRGSTDMRGDMRRDLPGDAHEICVLETRHARRELLRDQPLYRITSPLLISGPADS